MSAPLGKGIVVGSSVLSLMSFVVALGGLSALTHDCSGGSWTWTDTTSECAKFTQLEWYSIFLNLFLTIALVVLALKDALRQYQSTLHSFLALSTALLTICARNYLSPGSYTYSMAVGNYAVASKNAAVAGTIMMCIFNYAIMLALGWAAAGAKGAEDTYAV